MFRATETIEKEILGRTNYSFCWNQGNQSYFNNKHALNFQFPRGRVTITTHQALHDANSWLLHFQLIKLYTTCFLHCYYLDEFVSSSKCGRNRCCPLVFIIFLIPKIMNYFWWKIFEFWCFFDFWWLWRLFMNLEFHEFHEVWWFSWISVIFRFFWFLINLNDSWNVLIPFWCFVIVVSLNDFWWIWWAFRI